jgi:hypothetical protein
MRSLERRLQLLEAWSNPGSCLECECERLNMEAMNAPVPLDGCNHRRGLGLLDALRGLNAMEPGHANA